jgi:hypothetical protein
MDISSFPSIAGAAPKNKIKWEKYSFQILIGDIIDFFIIFDHLSYLKY